MKTIADAAMDAIEAGEAIVTGAVEITPLGLTNFTTLGAVNVLATDFQGTFAARSTTLTGFSTTDSFRVSKPSIADDPRLTWDAWSAWSSDGSILPTPPPVVGQTWNNLFSIYGNSGGSDVLLFTPTLSSNLYLTEAAAFAALAAQMPVTLTGYSTYKIVVPSDPTPSDNRNGLSLLVDRGFPVGAADPIRVWGGYGPIDFDTDSGTQTFTGVGARALAQQNAGAVGGVAQGLTLTLSGVEPAALPLLDGNEIKNASVVLYRLIFASDGKTLLDAHVFDRGRVDTVSTDETVGSDAAINLAVESSARGLGRQGARQRADSDQRLINSDDGYFKSTAYAGQKELYWGGKKPARVG